jgi:TPR repeat protein
VLEKLGRVLTSPLKRGVEHKLQAALDTLAIGWSLEAFQQLQTCAEQGMPDAQFALGRCYEEAQGVVQNLADAVHWYGLAAQQSHVQAQSRLGLIYLSASLPAAAIATAGKSSLEPARTINSTLGESFKQGFTVTQNLPAAFMWNQRAAEAGDADAQARLGTQYIRGIGTEANPTLGTHWLEKSAQQGCLSGMAQLGMLHAGAYSANNKTPSVALHWLHRAAKQDHAEAQYWLGMVLMQASNSEAADIPVAERNPLLWIKKSAQQGYLLAMGQLGVMYWRDQPNEQDLGLAETWLRRAAGRGHVQAMRWLGQLLLEQPNNDGVDAANLIRQAAEAGDTAAASLLAELYLEAKGLPRDAMEAERWLTRAGKDARPQAMTALAGLQAHSMPNDQGYAQAANWLRKAADTGHLAARFTLGSIYMRGKGVPADPQEAANWYLQAAQAGSVSAAFYLGMLYADASTPVHNDRQALHWLNTASLGGHALAHCNAALMVMTGRGQAKDASKAVVMLASAAGKGNVHAAEMLAEWYASGQHIPQDIQQVELLLLRALELGSVRAACMLVEGRCRGHDWSADWLNIQQLLTKHIEDKPPADSDPTDAAQQKAHMHLALGRGWEHGLVGAPDPTQALASYQAAALAGSAQAQAWMGDHERQQGQDVATIERAIAWYRQAAQQGHVGALTTWSAVSALLSKSDTLHDDAMLFDLWLSAASTGVAVAQRHVAHCYLDGRGCRMYPAAAVRWLTMAAQQGDAESQYLLGTCHADGVGTKPDWPLARLWFDRAAAQGHAPAQRRLAERAAPSSAPKPDQGF